jgi:hypothetical protein
MKIKNRKHPAMERVMERSGYRRTLPFWPCALFK